MCHVREVHARWCMQSAREMYARWRANGQYGVSSVDYVLHWYCVQLDKTESGLTTTNLNYRGS